MSRQLTVEVNGSACRPAGDSNEETRVRINRLVHPDRAFLPAAVFIPEISLGHQQIAVLLQPELLGIFTRVNREKVASGSNARRLQPNLQAHRRPACVGKLEWRAADHD